MDITKTGLLSNDDMITISPYACMPYQSWPRDPFLGSMETTKLAFVICLAWPYGIHLTFNRFQNRIRLKKIHITCYNMVFISMFVHQNNYNFVTKCMLLVLITCLTIYQHVLHKFRLSVSQTPNFNSIPIWFCFHVLVYGWILPTTFSYHIINKIIVFFIWHNSTQFIVSFNQLISFSILKIKLDHPFFNMFLLLTKCMHLRISSNL